MFPDFFKHKFKEVKSFLRSRKGTNDDRRNINEERKAYPTERGNAYSGIDPDSKRYQEDPQEKILRESGGQDISAI